MDNKPAVPESSHEGDWRLPLVLPHVRLQMSIFCISRLRHQLPLEEVASTDQIFSKKQLPTSRQISTSNPPQRRLPLRRVAMAGLPPLSGLPVAATAWSCCTGRMAEWALTPHFLQRTPPGPSPTRSVVVVALALFREELRKHPYFLNTFSFEDAPLPSPTERSHASALLAEHLLWLVVVAFFLRGVTQAPLLPEHLLF